MIVSFVYDNPLAVQYKPVTLQALLSMVWLEVFVNKSCNAQRYIELSVFYIISGLKPPHG